MYACEIWGIKLLGIDPAMPFHMPSRLRVHPLLKTFAGAEIHYIHNIHMVPASGGRHVSLVTYSNWLSQLVSFCDKIQAPALDLADVGMTLFGSLNHNVLLV
jgi:hypothetical protein